MNHFGALFLGRFGGSSSGRSRLLGPGTGPPLTDPEPPSFARTRGGPDTQKFSFTQGFSFTYSDFFAMARSSTAPIQVGAGRDVSIVTPHFAGSSASAAAGKSKTDDALIGTFDHIKYYHGGNLPVTAVDVAVKPYVYEPGRK